MGAPAHQGKHALGAPVQAGDSSLAGEPGTPGNPGRAEKPGKAGKAGKTGGIGALLPWALVVVGLAFLAWPVVQDWWYAWEAERAISEITSVYDDMSDPERLENLEQARAFNEALQGRDTGIELWEYRWQLTYKSTPKSMMAWIDIPKISTRLPIYHGTDDAVLAAGAGHCEWSSLPVGGLGMRSVLTAHSGMDRTRMFDDIRLLKEGDEFVVWALGEPYAYRVCDVQVILPEQTELLDPEPGRDLCSLITCTPLGINSHRLVVTGERCEYHDEIGQVEGAEPYLNGRTVPLLIALAAVLALAGVLWAVRSRRKRAGEKERRKAEVPEG